jgi:hypothetical protein
LQLPPVPPHRLAAASGLLRAPPRRVPPQEVPVRPSCDNRPDLPVTRGQPSREPATLPKERLQHQRPASPRPARSRPLRCLGKPPDGTCPGNWSQPCSGEGLAATTWIHPRTSCPLPKHQPTTNLAPTDCPRGYRGSREDDEIQKLSTNLL